MRCKILITGAAGVLGRDLIRRLGAQNVVGLVRPPNALHDVLPANNVYSLSDFYSNKIPFDDIAVVVHCAFARSQDGASLAQSIDFSRDVFHAAVSNNIPAVINISSQSIYGAYREIPSTEDGPINPMDMYAVSKYACEKLAAEISRGTKTKITNIRLSSLIGPHFPERVVNKMISAAINTGTLKVVGGNQVFSFLDITDASDAIVTMLKTSPKHWRDTYNIATSQHYTILEMANTIADVVGNTDIDFTPSETHQSVKNDTARFAHDFNWRAQKTLRDSVQNIYAHIKTASK